jgi:UDP-glucose 4-epimerase
MADLLINRCLVLGGKGFIGSHLVEALIYQGLSVRVFDKAGVENLIEPNLLRQIEFVDGDFSDSMRLVTALEDCDICFHLISTTLPKTSNDSPSYDLQSNVLNTINMLDISRKVGLKKIVFLSSGGTVYGVPKYLPIDEAHPTDPLCSYGIGKLAIEKYLELYRSLYGIDYAVLRVSNPYGERQRVNAAQGAIPVFLGKAINDERITIWGDGSVSRDYIHIGDVVESMIAAMRYAGKYRIFNIGSATSTTLIELLSTIQLIIHKHIAVDYLPARSFDVPVNVLDINLAKFELKWSPKVSLYDGILRMHV